MTLLALMFYSVRASFGKKKLAETPIGPEGSADSDFIENDTHEVVELEKNMQRMLHNMQQTLND